MRKDSFTHSAKPNCVHKSVLVAIKKYAWSHHGLENTKSSNLERKGLVIEGPSTIYLHLHSRVSTHQGGRWLPPVAPIDSQVASHSLEWDEANSAWLLPSDYISSAPFALYLLLVSSPFLVKVLQTFEDKALPGLSFFRLHTLFPQPFLKWHLCVVELAVHHILSAPVSLKQLSIFHLRNLSQPDLED